MKNINKAIAISSLLLSQACSNIPDHKNISDIRNTQRNNINSILEYKKPNIENEKISIENNVNIEKSIKFVGDIEVDNFMSFFAINKELFTKKVIELQSNFGIDVDGIIGPETLKNIYLNYYISNQNKLTHEVKARIKINEDMSKYNNVKGAKNGKLNVFNNNTYYGSDVGLNIRGTYINEKLVNKVPESLSTNENKIIISNIDGKTVLSLYIGGKLELATYSTPGINDGRHNTPSLITSGKNSPHMLHYSSEYPEQKNEYGEIIDKGGAVMPYAIHIDGSVWIHGSDSKIDGLDRSHGCIRVPLYFQNYLFQKVTQLGKDNIIIDTRNTY